MHRIVKTHAARIKVTSTELHFTEQKSDEIWPVQANISNFDKVEVTEAEDLQTFLNLLIWSCLD